MKNEIKKLLLDNPQPLYSQDGVDERDKRVLFYAVEPKSRWTWTCYEGNVEVDGDILCFGLVHGFVEELGYFSLDELMENGVMVKFSLNDPLQHLVETV